MYDRDRIRQIAPAPPGWWAELRDKDGDTFHVPIALWLLTVDGQILGVDPTGEGWDSDPVSTSQLVQYVFDPKRAA